MRVYNKLVRDKIIDKIINNNENPNFRYLNNEEYKIELIKKLGQEYKELKDAIDKENKEDILNESADVIEVIKSIVLLNNNSFDDIIHAMNQKKEKNGGFDKKIYLESVE